MTLVLEAACRANEMREPTINGNAIALNRFKRGSNNFGFPFTVNGLHTASRDVLVGLKAELPAPARCCTSSGGVIPT